MPRDKESWDRRDEPGTAVGQKQTALPAAPRAGAPSERQKILRNEEVSHLNQYPKAQKKKKSGIFRENQLFVQH